METITAIIFYLLLFDSTVVNIIAWGGEEKYVKYVRTLSRYFPITKGWAGLYLFLVLYIGFLTFFV